MKSFTTLQEEYEWHQEHLPGGPGYDDRDDDRDIEEPDYEAILERRRESKW
jgi:hypothetical protein